MLVELSVVEQRYQAVREALDTGATIIDVARRYGVDRRTVHRWLVRYATGGLGALADRSSKPDRCPHQIPAKVEARILALRRANPGWGPRTILSRLRRELQAPGATKHPDSAWVTQQARNLAITGNLDKVRFLVRNRDSKYSARSPDDEPLASPLRDVQPSAPRHSAPPTCRGVSRIRRSQLHPSLRLTRRGETSGLPPLNDPDASCTVPPIGWVGFIWERARRSDRKGRAWERLQCRSHRASWRPGRPGSRS
jgi:transposase-like protein